jgi:hypothetical protein
MQGRAGRRVGQLAILDGRVGKCHPDFMSAFRSSTPLLVLILLSACNPFRSQQDDDQANAAAANAAQPPANAAAPAADPAAQLEARAREALADLAANAATVPLRNLRAGVGGAVCGEVESGGEFRGFVVPPEARPVIGRKAGLDVDDIDDPYPSLYIRWCASAEELVRLTPQLTDTPDSTLETPTPIVETPPAAAQEPPAPTKQAPRPVRPRDPDADPRRFADQVLRPEER